MAFLCEKHKETYLAYYKKNRTYAKLIKKCGTTKQWKEYAKPQSYKNGFANVVVEITSLPLRNIN